MCVYMYVYVYSCTSEAKYVADLSVIGLDHIPSHTQSLWRFKTYTHNVLPAVNFYGSLYVLIEV